MNTPSIVTFDSKTPIVGVNSFIAPTAYIIGDVTIGPNATIFYGTVVRGDIQPIIIGEGTNIQEHAMLHTSRKRKPLVIGDEVTVGHRAILHGCQLGSRIIVGMGSILLDDAVIEDDCLIGAGSLITSGTVIPAGHLAFGSPAKAVRKLTEEEIAFVKESASHYKRLGIKYQQI